MNNIETFLRIMLGLHIAGGTVALLTGLGAMLTAKGGKAHRTFGKIYFWSMTAVFASAVVLAIGHQRTFLFIVAFFSYYLTVRGYRILYLKEMKAGWIDRVIGIVAGTFMVFLLTWATYSLILGNMMGIVGLVFGSIGTAFLVQDIRKFRSTPPRMHWRYAHIAGMGSSYVSAVTAFVVVNFAIPGFGWVLWILPSIVGGWLIGRSVRLHRAEFERLER